VSGADGIEPQKTRTTQKFALGSSGLKLSENAGSKKAMQIAYEVGDCVGVPGGQRFQIEDTDANAEAWRALCSDWVATMERALGVGPGDYEVGPWHNGMMSVFAHLYSRSFYHPRFIHDVVDILRRHGQCFAKFECFDASEMLGYVIVFPEGRAILDSLAVQSGLAGSIEYPGQ
jgi:hypothetical protein